MKNNDLQIEVIDGIMTGLRKSGNEFIYPGYKLRTVPKSQRPENWDKYSEFSMFPVIGKAAKNIKFENKEVYVGEKHGISRSLPWRKTETENEFTQIYFPDSPVKNDKFDPNNPKAAPEFISLPYNFIHLKSFNIEENILKTDFKIRNIANQDMKLEYGWHPWFNIHGSVDDGKFDIGGKDVVSLKDVIELSKTKEHPIFEGVDEVVYSNDKKGIHLVMNTKGFDNMALWSRGPEYGSFCMEPITHNPRRKGREPFIQGEYTTIQPGKSKEYSVALKPIITKK
ncbi:hypothetical protein K9L97_00320 [Candidatus Woesearchaeota archaeon]|nr:hypothetical protein [Candidatus Woesearchaeota archaeon]